MSGAEPDGALGGAVAIDEHAVDEHAVDDHHADHADHADHGRSDVDPADGGEGSDPGRPDDGTTGGPAPLALSTELARVTGLLLVVLLPVHLVTVLLADPTEVDRLLDRWENQWWLLADWGFLTVGLAHCLLSLRARVLALGSGPSASSACPHCGGALPVTDDRFGVLAYRLLVGLTGALYLAASWAMLRLV